MRSGTPERSVDHSPGSRARTPRVLVAEDEPDLRGLLAHWLCEQGYVVEECRDAPELRRKLAGPDLPDLLLTDVHLPGATGLEVVAELRERGQRLPVVAITAFGDRFLHEQARGLDAVMIDKPFDLEHLGKWVRRLLPASCRD